MTAERRETWTIKIPLFGIQSLLSNYKLSSFTNWLQGILFGKKEIVKQFFFLWFQAIRNVLFELEYFVYLSLYQIEGENICLRKQKRSGK